MTTTTTTATETETETETTTTTTTAMPSNRRFGVEIETYGLGLAAAAAIVARVVGGVVRFVGGVYSTHAVADPQGREWRVMSDSSIRGNGVPTAEVVTPPMSGGEDMETVQNVCRALFAAGARSDVQHGCGIHVHVDGTAMTTRTVANLATTIYKYEALICAAVTDSSRRHWAANIRPEQVERLRAAARRSGSEMARLSYDANVAWYGAFNARPTHYDNEFQTRYRGLNVHSLFFRGTVEFRYFDGTLHAGKVKSYVQLCLAMVAKAEQAKSPRMTAIPRGDGDKFYMRTWLKDLGLVGDAYKTARLHLLSRLSGSSVAPRMAPPSRRSERAEGATQDGQAAALPRW